MTFARLAPQKDGLESGFTRFVHTVLCMYYKVASGNLANFILE